MLADTSSEKFKLVTLEVFGVEKRQKKYYLDRLAISPYQDSNQKKNRRFFLTGVIHHLNVSICQFRPR